VVGQRGYRMGGTWNLIRTTLGPLFLDFTSILAEKVFIKWLCRKGKNHKKGERSTQVGVFCNAPLISLVIQGVDRVFRSLVVNVLGTHEKRGGGVLDTKKKKWWLCRSCIRQAPKKNVTTKTDLRGSWSDTL